MSRKKHFQPNIILCNLAVVLFLITFIFLTNNGTKYSEQEMMVSNDEDIIILYDWQNISYVSPSINDDNNFILNHLIICIGVQKSGTSSIRSVMINTQDIIAKNEFHYFDKLIFDQHRKPNNQSFENILNWIYQNNLSVTGYIQQLIDFYRIDTKSMLLSKYHIFEKTPKYVLYPHAAYIIANDFIQHGTKILLLLRNPIKRLISGYFQWRAIYNTFIVNSTFDEYIIDFISNPYMINFRNALDSMYIEYIQSVDVEDKSSVMIKMIHIYQETFYKLLTMTNSSDSNLIWLRSCYGPQVLVWIYYIQTKNQLSKYKHSFKILQSERYYDPQTYHETVNYLLCYTHYNIHDDNYDEWMENCVEKDMYNASNRTEKKVNSRTPPRFSLKKQDFNILTDSFSVCNNWLRVITKLNSEYIFLNGFNWTYIQ